MKGGKIISVQSGGFIDNPFWNCL